MKLLFCPVCQDVFKLTKKVKSCDDLIDKVDEYEGKEYKRISIKTLTGNECQMYVKR